MLKHSYTLLLICMGFLCNIFGKIASTRYLYMSLSVYSWQSVSVLYILLISSCKAICSLNKYTLTLALEIMWSLYGYQSVIPKYLSCTWMPSQRRWGWPLAHITSKPPWNLRQRQLGQWKGADARKLELWTWTWECWCQASRSAPKFTQTSKE